MTEKFGDILRNPHFSQFSALLSVPFRSYQWRHRNPEVPFWTLWENCTKLLNDARFAHKESTQEFLHAFTDLITAITHADQKLFYRQEDLLWLVQVLDGDRALVTMAMLFAYASASDTYLTPVQVAEATGTSESLWRNRAAANEIIGAHKAGKQWLFSRAALRAYGVMVDLPVGTEATQDMQE